MSDNVYFLKGDVPISSQGGKRNNSQDECCVCCVCEGHFNITFGEIYNCFYHSPLKQTARFNVYIQLNKSEKVVHYVCHRHHIVMRMQKHKKYLPNIKEEDVTLNLLFAFCQELSLLVDGNDFDAYALEVSRELISREEKSLELKQKAKECKEKLEEAEKEYHEKDKCFNMIDMPNEEEIWRKADECADAEYRFLNAAAEYEDAKIEEDGCSANKAIETLIRLHQEMSETGNGP